jgi:hypothetical protein
VIPLPVILAEVIMALGGALLLANLWVLVRPMFKPDAPPPASRGKAVANALIGLVVLTWGFASFVTGLGNGS